MTSRVVVLAVDGSEPSNKAFQWYLDNVQKEGDHVFVITCAELSSKIDLGILPGNYTEEKLKQIIDQAKAEGCRVDKMLAEYVDGLRAKKIRGEGRQLPEKNAGHAICEFSEQHGAALICMGTRGMGTVRRTVLGSVSDYVVHHAKCATIVIH